MSAPTRDWSLGSGERQTAPTVAGVRADHRVRYEWAAQLVGERGAEFGVDAFCGTGYGTLILASTIQCGMLGIDGSSQAVQFAGQRFGTPTTLFAHKIFPFDLPRDAFDFATCFESIEHVAEGPQLLAQLARAVKPGGWLFVSSPSLSRKPVHMFPWHVRHYTETEVCELLPEYALVEARGQQYAEREIGTLHPESFDADIFVLAFRRRLA